MKHWTIYCHTHTDSGRRYIGLTSQTMEKRWKNHIYAAKSSKDGRWHFPNAIRKYGKDAFTHKILEICDTLESAGIAEVKWIKFYDSRNPDRGFNLTKGGEYAPSVSRIQRSEIVRKLWQNSEYREKVIASTRNSYLDPSLRAKASKISKDMWEKPGYREIIKARNSIASKELWKRPGFRTKMSDISKEIQSRPEVKMKLSNANKGKIISHENRVKIGDRCRGKKLSAEHRAKISASTKGKSKKPFSAEHRANISKGLKGKTRSPEVRAKIRDRLKEYFLMKRLKKY